MFTFPCDTFNHKLPPRDAESRTDGCQGKLIKLPTSKYEDCRELHEDGHDSGVADGVVLYETPYSLLLIAFVRYNDVANLDKYLQNHDYDTYGHVEVYDWDPFYLAAES